MLLNYKEFLGKAKIILGSQSKGRLGLLKMINLFQFEVYPSQFEEDLDKSLPPRVYVQKTCEGKVRDLLNTFSQTNHPWDICIFADTVCEINGKIIEKAKSKEEATQFLRMFSDSSHLVHTCLYVVGRNKQQQLIELYDIETTEVHFAHLSEKSIENYVSDQNNWQGRAGAYAIQAVGNILIKKIVGDYSNVIGLPLPILDKLMAEAIDFITK